MSKKKPRETVITLLQRSSQAIGQLYPVLKDADTDEVLDGRTRLQADPNWRIEYVKTKTKEERLKIKYHANWHRKTIDRQKVLKEIADETGWRGLKPFAEFLGVSERTISSYLPQEYKLEASGPNSDPSTLKDLQSFEKFNFDLSTWLGQYERPEGYGSKEFHGNCSPTVIYGLLSKYASLEDLLLDPMAGSGTFVDVAKAMGYKKILVYDIKSMRNDIKQVDAGNTQLEDESIGFIFAHFPYWNLVQYTDNNDQDLSRMKLDQFFDKVEKIFREMYRVLKKNHFFAVMIGNLRHAGLHDLESDFSVIGRKYFTLWDKIIKEIQTWEQETRGQRMGLALARAKARNSTIINHDTILVFRRS